MNITELQKKYKLLQDDFWEVRKGTWVVKHDAIERIATQERIEFDIPSVNLFEKTLCLLGSANKNGGNKIWTTGEASDENVKGQGKYYWAMAEKRLKDRLTLKLINAYEFGIYSDVEADNFKKNGGVGAKNYTKTNAKKILWIKIRKALNFDETGQPSDEEILEVINSKTGFALKSVSVIDEKTAQEINSNWL